MNSHIYSWLSRLNTARGSGTGLVTVGPAKVIPDVKIKIISQFCRIGKDCDQNGDRMSKNDENLPHLH